MTDTDKYVVMRVNADKNLYRIDGPLKPPYFVQGCLGIGRELADSEIPDDVVDLSQLNTLERNIVITVREARREFHEKKKKFIERINLQTLPSNQPS